MSNNAHMVIAIDWGTTSLRAALMDETGQIIERCDTSRGVMRTDGKTYPAIFAELFTPWLNRYPNAIVLAAGMITSGQGWFEVPYVECPATFDDLQQHIRWERVEGRRVGFVPGLVDRAVGREPDVMRSEEIQVFGAIQPDSISRGVYVLPGTHSKWVEVESARITTFRTYMTGELFDLLKRHSTLGLLMPDKQENDSKPFYELLDGAEREAFDKGCAIASRGGSAAFLNRLFSVRTLGVIGKLPPETLSHYLSGILIGEEVYEALSRLASPPLNICLIGRVDLAHAYQRCLSLHAISSQIIENTAFKGLWRLAQRIKHQSA